MRWLGAASIAIAALLVGGCARPASDAAVAAAAVPGHDLSGVVIVAFVRSDDDVVAKPNGLLCEYGKRADRRGHLYVPAGGRGLAVGLAVAVARIEGPLGHVLVEPELVEHPDRCTFAWTATVPDEPLYRITIVASVRYLGSAPVVPPLTVSERVLAASNWQVTMRSPAR